MSGVWRVRRAPKEVGSVAGLQRALKLGLGFYTVSSIKQ